MSGPPLLCLNGPPGAGKTTVGGAVHDILSARHTPSTFVDFDALTRTWPKASGAPFNWKLGLANLRSVWEHASAAGSRNLVVASVIETRGERAELADAIQASAMVVVRLQAPVAAMQQRLRARETGAALAWHQARAAELTEQFSSVDPSDAIVDTDGRMVEDIAADCVALVDWEA